MATLNATTVNGVLRASSIYPYESAAHGGEDYPVFILPKIKYDGPDNIDPTHNDPAYLKALIKHICKKYPNTVQGLWIGESNPNSISTTTIHIYDTSDVSNELPRHSSGTSFSLGGDTYKFGTIDYKWYFYITVNNSNFANTLSTLKSATINGNLTLNGDFNIKSTAANTTFQVIRNKSISTSTIGYWAAMINSAQAGSPVLPTSGWWHVISMDWQDNNTLNWISQVAFPTRDCNGKPPYYRHNTGGSDNIDSATWHAFITDENISSQSVKYAGTANYANSSGTASRLQNISGNASSEENNKGNIIQSYSTSGTWGAVFQWCSTPSRFPTDKDSDNWYFQLRGLTDGSLAFRMRVNGGSWTSFDKLIKASQFSYSNGVLSITTT